MARVLQSTVTAPCTTLSWLQGLLDVAGMDCLIFLGSIAVILVFRNFKHHYSQKNGKPVQRVRCKMAATTSANCVGGAVAPKAPAQLPLPRLVDLTIAQRIQANRALDGYAEHRDAGQHAHLGKLLTAAGSQHTALDYYIAVVQCAGRSANPILVIDILDDMKKAGLQPPISLYESAMRLLAAKKLFREALTVYDRLDSDGLKASAVSLSCLVGFSVENGDGDRAIGFFNQLEEVDVPSMRACMMIMRVYADRKDWKSSVALIERMRKRGAPVDALMLNSALTMGVSCKGRLADAEALLIANPPEADAISYNIVLKGLASHGEVSRAFGLLELMQDRGVDMNLITVNTAMDAAVRGGRCDDAWRLYGVMCENPRLRPDKCTCTTLIKALQRQPERRRLHQILDLFDQVLPDCPRDLTQRLFDSLFSVSVRPPIQNVECAKRCFSKVTELKLKLHGSDLWSYVVLLARNGDAVACSMAWAHTGGCRELEARRAAVEEHLHKDLLLPQAILKVSTNTLQAPLAPRSGAGTGTSAAVKRQPQMCRVAAA